MFFTRKRSKRWTTMEMCKFRMDTRSQLLDTYWDHAGNQTVCQSAMDQLPNLHVSKKADEAWILAYVESIREVYSHASGNLPELLFTDAQREEERKRYWSELSKMLNKVLFRITQLPDAHHPFSPLGRMACMMAYASLYSVYKTVAIECNNLTTIHSTAKKLSTRLPPRRRSSADDQKIRVETPLSAHLRDFPKTFIEELQAKALPIPQIVIMDDLYDEPETTTATSSESPLERNSSRYVTVEDFAGEVAAEVVTTALQQIVEDKKVLFVESKPVAFVPFVLPPKKEEKVAFVPFIAPQKEEEKDEKVDGPLELTPFDPAICFKEQDKINRYGLFDSPLPVIGRKKPLVPLIARQHSTPSESKDQPKTHEPAPSLLSPTFNQKVENKIIQAVLNEKPVSPMFPPPVFALDGFVIHRERF